MKLLNYAKLPCKDCSDIVNFGLKINIYNMCMQFLGQQPTYKHASAEFLLLIRDEIQPLGKAKIEEKFPEFLLKFLKCFKLFHKSSSTTELGSLLVFFQTMPKIRIIIRNLTGIAVLLK